MFLMYSFIPSPYTSLFDEPLSKYNAKNATYFRYLAYIISVYNFYLLIFYNIAVQFIKIKLGIKLYME